MFTLWSYHFITSNIFSSTFYPMLCLPHSIGHGLAQCICGYPIDLIEIHLLQYSHRGKHNTTRETKTFCFMGNIVLSHGNMKYNILVMELLLKILDFMFHTNKHMSTCYFPSIFHVNKLISCSFQMEFAIWLMSPTLISIE